MSDRFHSTTVTVTTLCTQICSSQKDFDAFLNDLKLKPCPYCKAFGTLNRHGFLRGYEHPFQQKCVRGRRVFCSNRNAARGCGRTFSVYLADKLKRFSLTAPRLWAFLKQVVRGDSKSQAFRGPQCGLSGSSSYRIWKRFLETQSAIRTSLYSLCRPPDIRSGQPAKLTLAHLEAAFADHPLDPISAFQATLQVSFM